MISRAMWGNGSKRNW
ncbi:hypothetical protein EYF80_067922 [Liparis tanakae]|uniref:Uncharacterized protein n=1 Tax=Liparis tanakae TaxID=230148 RepID=A0A4Z2DZL8_9TELE|nr:hypothetical protein EYF80_067922 [Liparis tanakae]